MQTVILEKDRLAARSQYLIYRKAVRTAKGKLSTDAERRQFQEDDALRRASLEMSRGFKVLDLVGSMRRAGTFDNGLPKLAIARADQPHVFCAHDRNGVRFLPSLDWRQRKCDKSLRFEFATGIVGPPLAAEKTGKAMVPLVPPSLRPTGSMDKYHILWEAVWEKAPPVDPILMRRLSKNLFAVVAVWDLTDLERAVLNGRL